MYLLGCPKRLERPAAAQPPGLTLQLWASQLGIGFALALGSPSFEGVPQRPGQRGLQACHATPGKRLSCLWNGMVPPTLPTSPRGRGSHFFPSRSAEAHSNLTPL